MRLPLLRVPTSLSGTGREFDLVGQTNTTGTITGTFSPKSSISVTTSGGGTFNGSYESSYDQPVSLAAVAGSYMGAAVTGATVTTNLPVTISSTGAITLPETNSCAGSGRATPRASGKNVPDVSVTFTGVGCALGNGVTVTGIGIYEDGVLVSLALNGAQTDGFIFAGEK